MMSGSKNNGGASGPAIPKRYSRAKISMNQLFEFLLKYRQINITMLDQAMVSGTSFLTGILLARFLGIEEFGRFSLAWMVILFANSIQMAMINTPMMSIGPKQSENQIASYYGAVIVQQVCFTTISFFFILLGINISAAVFPEWRIAHLALPLATVAFFFQNQDFLRRFFFTINQPTWAFINDAISNISQLLLIVVFPFITEISTSAALTIIAGTSGFAVLIGIFFMRHYTLRYNQVAEVLKKNWCFSKWITASAILQWTSGNLFIITAGNMVGPTIVGAIKASQNIMGITHILFQGLENIVPVKASFYYTQSGIRGLIAYLKKVALWGGLLTGCIAFTAGLTPEIWLSIFYGDQYQNFGYILQWYAVIYMLIFFGLLLRTGLRTLETTRPIFMAYILMTIFAMSLAKHFIIWFDISGVMYGILGTQIILLTSLAVSMFSNIKKII